MATHTRNRWRFILAISLLVFGLSTAFLSGYVLHAEVIFEEDSFPILKQAFDIFEKNSFFDLPDEKTLEYGMIRGMLQAGQDPYAAFLEPVQHEMETNTLKGNSGGSGVPSVTWRIDPEIAQVAIIKVTLIAASTPDEVKNAFAQSTDDGATHFILDLRDNGGGLLTAGIDTARLFLRQGIILQEQYRGQQVETYRVSAPGMLVEYPLAVIVNHATASAAEILAGSLQAHGRAKIVGENTFGKNTIQLVFGLEDGSSLHVTAAKWWIPAPDHPSGEGMIRPDVLLSPEESNSEEAIRIAIDELLEE